MARNNQNQAARERGCSASFPMIPLIVIILAQVGTSSDNAALGIAVQELVGALAPPSPMCRWRTLHTRSLRVRA